jgi:hypothetical protein
MLETYLAPTKINKLHGLKKIPEKPKIKEECIDSGFFQQLF